MADYSGQPEDQLGAFGQFQDDPRSWVPYGQPGWPDAPGTVPPDPNAPPDPNQIGISEYGLIGPQPIPPPPPTQKLGPGGVPITDEVAAAALGQTPPVGNDLIDPATGQPVSADQAAVTGLELPPGPDEGGPAAIPAPDAVSGAGSYAAPPPMPDAVSGAGVYQPIPAAEALAQPNRELDEAALQKQIHEASPEEFANLYGNHQIAAKRIAFARALKEADRQVALIEQHHRTLADARAKADQARANVEARAAKLDAMKIDPDLHGGQKIASVIMAVIGGLISGKTGGPNTAMPMINDMVNRNVDAQKANIAKEQAALGVARGNVADMYQRSQTDYEQGEAYRLASLKAVDAQILAQQQNYDPKGSAFLESENLRRQVHAQMAAVSQAVGDHTFKRAVDVAKIDQEQQKIDIDRAKAAAEIAKKAGAGGGTGTGGLIPVEELEKTYGVRPDKPMTLKDYGTFLHTSHASGEVVAQRKVQADLGRDLRVGQEGEFKNADGTEYTAPNTAEANKLREKKAGVDTLAHIMDDVRRLRTGWSNSAYNREEYKRISAEWGQAKIAYKNFAGLGALSESDMNLMDSALGSEDPTKFLDQSAGIDQARKTMLGSFSDEMHAKGWKPDPKAHPGGLYTVPDMSKPGKAPAKTEVDKLAEGANERNWTERHEGVIGFGTGGAGVATGKAAGEVERQKNVDNLGSLVGNEDAKTSAAASAHLKDIAENGPTAETRAHAQAVLDRALEKQAEAAAASAAQPTATYNARPTPKGKK